MAQAFGNFQQRIRRGQYWVLAGTLKSSGTPMDLTGWTGALNVNTWPKGATPLYTNAGVTLGGALGTFLIAVPSSVTTLWPSNGPLQTTNRLIYDLTLVDGSTNQYPVLCGELLVEEIAANA